MMVTDILERVRSHLAEPGVTKAGLAVKAGLHPNTLRDADQASWNPTAATLKALEPHLPRITADWPIGSANNGAEIIRAEQVEGADSHRPFSLTSSRTCPSSDGPATGLRPLPCSTGEAEAA
jgi:hypothetical protein